MNFQKNPTQARRMAVERKKLEQIAVKRPERLSSTERRRLNDELRFDNVEEYVEEAPEDRWAS